MSSDDSEACIMSQLHVCMYTINQKSVFWFLMLIDVWFGNPLWVADVFMF